MNSPEIYRDLAAERIADLGREADRHPFGSRLGRQAAPGMRQRAGRLLMQLGRRLADDG